MYVSRLGVYVCMYTYSTLPNKISLISIHYLWLGLRFFYIKEDPGFSLYLIWSFNFPNPHHHHHHHHSWLLNLKLLRASSQFPHHQRVTVAVVAVVGSPRGSACVHQPHMKVPSGAVTIALLQQEPLHQLGWNAPSPCLPIRLLFLSLHNPHDPSSSYSCDWYVMTQTQAICCECFIFIYVCCVPLFMNPCLKLLVAWELEVFMAKKLVCLPMLNDIKVYYIG